MRKLTLLGFLSAYVKSLSECKALNIHKLIQEVYDGNDRLREPLFMYCHYSNKSNVLSKYLTDTDKSELNHIEWLLTNNKNDELPVDYIKVINSYNRKAGMKDNDNHIKALMLAKIIALKTQKSVSNYRIYTDLKINAGNFNDFVKNRNLNRLSTDKSREVYNYLQAL